MYPLIKYLIENRNYRQFKPLVSVYSMKEYEQNLKNRNIYIDKQSGKDLDREEYQELKKILCEGDTLIVKELDRLGRNKKLE